MLEQLVTSILGHAVIQRLFGGSKAINHKIINNVRGVGIDGVGGAA